MSDASQKPAIPAWQRATQGVPPPEVKSNADPSQHPSSSQSDGNSSENAAESLANDDEPVAEPASADAQLDMVEAFLSDPKVKDEPIEKKRVFLRSKNVPVETIDAVLAQEPAAAVKPQDFEAFRQQHVAPTVPKTSKPSPQTSISGSPPIITYPEFLVEAHKPAPLITPSRALIAAYCAAGFATLMYGASKYIIEPMSDSLTEARCEYYRTNLAKLSELNTRLHDVVSKAPNDRSEKPMVLPSSAVDEEKDDDSASLVSDPTELFHRDIGTQTSPLPSPQPADPLIDPLHAGVTPAEVSALSTQTSILQTIQSHLDSLVSSTDDRLASAHRERKESMNNLRHYLDTVLYGSMVSQLWMPNGDGSAVAGVKEGSTAERDVVEDLKKEIRSVKGVLLSARRFPTVHAGRIGG